MSAGSFVFSIDKNLVGSDQLYYPAKVNISASCGSDDFDATDIFDEIGSDSQKIRISTSNNDALVVKTFILDAYTSYEGVNTLYLRSVDFYLNGVLVDITSGDLESYGCTSGSSAVDDLFITALSKTGTWAATEWISTYTSNDRLYCIFKNPIKFDSIVINNHHNSGSETYNGIKDAKISISLCSVSTTVLDEVVDGQTILFDGEIPEHVGSNVVDNYFVDLTLSQQVLASITYWNSTTKTGQLRVLFPYVSSIDTTTLLLVYDSTFSDNITFIGINGDILSQSVWDSHYINAYTLSQDPSTGVDSIIDSTSNNTDASPSGSPPALVCGLGSMCVEFDGANYIRSDYLDRSALESAFTIELSHNIDVVSDGMQMLVIGANSTGAIMLSAYTTTGSYALGVVEDLVQSNTLIPTTTDTNVVLTYDGTAITLFINSVEDTATNNVTIQSLTVSRVYIGAHETTPAYTDGKLADVLISDVVRSEDWLALSNESTQDNLITLALPSAGNIDTQFPTIAITSVGGDPMREGNISTTWPQIAVFLGRSFGNLSATFDLIATTLYSGGNITFNTPSFITQITGDSVTNPNPYLEVPIPDFVMVGQDLPMEVDFAFTFPPIALSGEIDRVSIISTSFISPEVAFAGDFYNFYHGPIEDDITLPAILFSSGSFISTDISLITAEFAGQSDNVCHIQVVTPSFSLEMSGDNAIVGGISFDIPAMLSAMYSGGEFICNVPMATVQGIASNTYLGVLSSVFPKIATFITGDYIDKTLLSDSFPQIACSVSGNNTGVAKLSGELPKNRINISALNGGVGNITLFVDMVSMVFTGYCNGPNNINATFLPFIISIDSNVFTDEILTHVRGRVR